MLAGGLERPGLQPQLQEEHGFRVVRRGNVSLRGTGSPGETYAASVGGGPAVQVRVRPGGTWQADVPASPAAFGPSTIDLECCGLLGCRTVLQPQVTVMPFRVGVNYIGWQTDAWDGDASDRSLQ